MVAVPKGHAWEGRKRITSDELTRESLLLLGEGHCFRDQVLDICHMVRARDRSALARTVEGGSLETIRQMVAGGVGITVLPSTSVDAGSGPGDLIRILPFARPCPRGAWPRLAQELPASRGDRGAAQGDPRLQPAAGGENARRML